MNGTTPITYSPKELETFLELLEPNHLLWSLLEISEKLGIQSWAIGAGFLQQSVWNVLHGRESLENIKDIDWVYFDDSDLSAKAESLSIDQVQKQLRHSPVPLDIKNQARVHLWYKKKVGYEIPAPWAEA